MQTDTLTIPGLPGPVTVQVNAWTGGCRLFISGARVPTTRRGRFEIARPDGLPVRGRLLTPYTDAFPKVEVNGDVYPTGPATPIGLRILALLPVVLFVGGALGIVLGGFAIIANFTVIRSGASTFAVVATCIGTVVAGALLYLLTAGLLTAAFGG